MTDTATVDLDASDQGSAQPDDLRDGQGDPAELGDAGRRAIQAERARAADAERQFRDAQQQLTTQAARITELETERGSLATQVETLTSEGLRYRVAVEKGLAPELVTRLVGTTVEELSADADSLLGLMGARTSAPRPDPSQGSRTPAPQTAAAQFKSALGSMLNP